MLRDHALSHKRPHLATIHRSGEHCPRINGHLEMSRSRPAGCKLQPTDWICRRLWRCLSNFRLRTEARGLQSPSNEKLRLPQLFELTKASAADFINLVGNR